MSTQINGIDLKPAIKAKTDIIGASVALETGGEIAKVPKSDAAVTWNSTALASINAEVDTALNTAVPATPTAGSLNDALSKAAGGNTFDKSTDSLEALSDKVALNSTVAKTTELISGAAVDFGGVAKTSIQTAAAAAITAAALATAANLAIVAGYIDTEIATIIAATDTVETEIAKIPKSDSTVSWNATALAAIKTQAASALTDAALGTAAELAKVPKSDSTVSWNATALAAIQAQAAAALAAVAHKRQAGVTQIFQKVVQQAANVGAYTLATMTTQACLTKDIVVKAVTAAQADLTSAAVTGGAANAVTFLSATDAAKANIDAIDEQVSWSGAVELAATKTIVMTLAGTGVTAVNLLVTIRFEAVVDGGYLA